MQFLYFTSSRPLIRSRKKTALGEVLSPKGRSVVSQFQLASLPPRFSRRETPINWARHYPAAGNAVKAILPLNGGGRRSGIEGQGSGAGESEDRRQGDGGLEEAGSWQQAAGSRVVH